MQKIYWWSKAENRYYPYHSYKKNCATQVRDILNEALNGQIKEKYGRSFTQNSWRTYWQKYFLHWPITKFAGDLIFNRKIDQKITLWEEMFIPDQLRTQLLALKIITPHKGGRSAEG